MSGHQAAEDALAGLLAAVRAAPGGLSLHGHSQLTGASRVTIKRRMRVLASRGLVECVGSGSRWVWVPVQVAPQSQPGRRATLRWPWEHARYARRAALVADVGRVLQDAHDARLMYEAAMMRPAVVRGGATPAACAGRRAR